jgi:Fe-S oxidoreductase
MHITTEQKTIDGCRFCYMCRHVCTVARCTDEEELSPQSRALALSMILRGSLQYAADVADDISQCCLCGWCRMWCEGKRDFGKAALEARKDLVDQGCVPASVAALADRLLRTGSSPRTGDPAPGSAGHSRPAAGEVLLILGDAARNGDPGIGQAALSLVKKAGGKARLLETEDNGGLALYLLGYAEEGRKRIRSFFDAVAASGVREVVVVSPDLYFLFAQDMLPEISAGRPSVTVRHIAPYLLQKARDGALRVDGRAGRKRKTVVHDNDFLARLLPTPLLDEPRELLGMVRGVELTGMFWEREKCLSAGSWLLAETYPRTAALVARKRLEDLQEAAPDLVVTMSGHDKLILTGALREKRSAEGPADARGGGFEVRDLVEILDEACG